MWKIEKVVKKGDYLYAVVKEHPRAIKYGYVLLHRVIMENFLGRLLNPNEVVHHKNGNTFDNTIENLELMVVGQHEKFHALQVGKKWCVVKCPNCGKYFERAYNQTHLQKHGIYSCCSKHCRTIFQCKLLQGKTPELEKAISENIVRIFKKFHDNSEQTADNGMRRDYTPSI